MKLFIDDERPAPTASWVLAKTAEEAIAILDDSASELTRISFDHDLGAGGCGYDIVCHLENLHHGEGIELHPDLEITVHSANPPGAERIARACSKILGGNWTTFLVDYLRLCRWENEGN